MVLDTSAVIAILFDEPERERISAALAADPTRLLSAATFLEAAMVVEARVGAEGGANLDDLLRRLNAEIVPVNELQAFHAREAWRTFGEGRHATGLNFGDCFSYALARTSGEPLLFKGNDFSRTDVDAAPY